MPDDLPDRKHLCISAPSLDQSERRAAQRTFLPNHPSSLKHVRRAWPCAVGPSALSTATVPAGGDGAGAEARAASLSRHGVST